MKRFTSTDYTFPVRITEKCYETKPDSSQISQMKFHPTEVSCTDFSNMIKAGYAYCPSSRSKKDVTDCHVISIDVDGSTVPMESYVSKLNDQPSIYYTTLSNGDVQKSITDHGDEEHIYRFRLVYVLSTPTLGNEDFKKAYLYIVSSNNMECVDVREANQYYNGSYNCSLYNNDIIYQLPIEYKETVVSTTKAKSGGSSQDIHIQHNNTTSDEPLYQPINEEFLKDLYSLTPSFFIMKYSSRYELFNSNLHNYNATDGYYLLDEDYIELKRRWNLEPVPTSSGVKKMPRIVRKQDGQKRRHTLYITARLFLKMKDITLEHLIVLMVNERQCYYDNSDRVLTNKWLINMCRDVYATRNDDRLDIQKNTKAFKVDKQYWQERGLTVRQAVPTIRKQLRYKEIDAIYDPTQKHTNKEWVSILKERGIKISLATFKRYKKERALHAS